MAFYRLSFTGSNILSKTRYAYTTGTVGAALQTMNYTYGDSNWKDKLTKYNNQTISYDNSGNPINYRDNWTFTWQKGRQLAGASDGTDTITYGYNPDG